MESWLSGLRRMTGNRVWAYTPPRVQIPNSPRYTPCLSVLVTPIGFFLCPPLVILVYNWHTCQEGLALLSRFFSMPAPPRHSALEVTVCHERVSLPPSIVEGGSRVPDADHDHARACVGVCDTITRTETQKLIGAGAAYARFRGEVGDCYQLPGAVCLASDQMAVWTVDWGCFHVLYLLSGVMPGLRALRRLRRAPWRTNSHRRRSLRSDQRSSG